MLGQHSLWLTHTKELLNQAKERCENNLNCSTSIISDGQCDVSGYVVFATVQTLGNIIDKEEIKQDEFGLIIVDECFPKGTKINTPTGCVNIEDIKIGDNVYSYNHVKNKIEIKKVNYLFHKETDDLLEIKTSDKKIICTRNHPIYTNKGYVNAECLVKGDVVYEMCLLSKRHIRKQLSKKQMVKDDAKIKKNRAYILFSRLWYKMGSSKSNKLYSIRQRTRKNDKQQSYEERRYKKISIENIKRKKSQTYCERWKRNGYDNTTKNVIYRVKKEKNLYDTRTTNKDSSKKWKWLSNLLQSRFGITRFENWYRNRWTFTQSYRKKKTRYEKRYILRELRVDDIKVQKQRSVGKYGRSCSKSIVYNIGVDDNHNYFVNNILVHNCHHLATNAESVMMFEKCINYFSARYKLGLTATLHRSDGLEKTTTKILGNVIYELKKNDTKDKLIGYYEGKPIVEVPADLFQVPAKINVIHTRYDILDKDVYDINGGTLVFTKLISDLSMNEERNDLILDLLSKLNGYTIIISERVDQLHYLDSKISSSVCIDGKTPKKKREQMVEEFKNGKHKVLLASYSLVAEGFDVPMLENIIMASPVKDERLVIQSIGRCQRPYGNKKLANVYDLVDDVSMLNRFFSKRKSVYKKEGWKIV